MAFSLASYNVLADSYIHPRYYPQVPSALLDPSRRLPALADRIVGLAADVICLQEVEPPSFRAFAGRLSPLGYQGHYAQKGAGRPDGCVTFLGRRMGAAGPPQTLHYRDGAEDALDSGHVALLVDVMFQGRRLGIVNTHLRWEPPSTPLEQSLPARQLRHLLEVLRDGGLDDLVICGDFNLAPDRAVLRLLTQAGFADAHAGMPQRHTAYANGTAQALDYVFSTQGLRAHPVSMPLPGDDQPLPSGNEPSDHLPLLVSFDLG